MIQQMSISGVVTKVVTVVGRGGEETEMISGARDECPSTKDAVYTVAELHAEWFSLCEPSAHECNSETW